MILGVHAVKDALELHKLLERRLAHHFQNLIAGVLGCYFQPARHVEANKLLVILSIGSVNFGVATAMHREVVAHTATNKRLFDLGQRINTVVDIEQGSVVIV